jgi:dolichol kinase
VSYGHGVALMALTGMLVVMILLEYVRLQLKLDIPLLRYLYNFRRRKEEDHIGGEIYFLLGVIVSLAVFEMSVAVAAVLMTVFGDMTAALVGKRFGRIRPSAFGGKKSLEGAAAALLVNMVIGILFLRASATGHLWWQGLVSGAIGLDSSFGYTLWPVALVMAVVATTVELTISKINDNLTIPVISGFAGQLTMLLALH